MEVLVESGRRREACHALEQSCGFQQNKGGTDEGGSGLLQLHESIPGPVVLSVVGYQEGIDQFKLDRYASIGVPYYIFCDPESGPCGPADS